METKYLAILLVASLVMISVVGAQPVPQTTQHMKDMLAAGVSDMQCRTTFDTDLINAIISAFPSLSSQLSLRLPILQADMQALSQYADNGDGRDFHGYLEANFSVHLKEDNTDIMQVLSSLRDDKSLDKNTTKTKMRALKATNDGLVSTLNACSNVSKHVTLVITSDEDSLNTYENVANNMASKGVYSGNMLDLVTSARSEILAPLKAATAGVTDAGALRTALGSYCLDDGCVNGTNFHMAVKFELARMRALLAAISPEVTDPDMVVLDNKAQDTLNSASSIVDSWGTSDAKPDQLKSVWSFIGASASTLHEVYVTTKGGDNTPQNG